MKISRRKFLEKSGKAGIVYSALGASVLSRSAYAENEKKRKICVFSKHLQWLDYTNMAKTASDIGFDGIDLTVRPKGHVLPENVVRDLPQAFEAIAKAGIETIMITTAIKNATDVVNQNILKTAGDLGIKFYRMGWLKYDKSLSIQKNHDKFEIDLRKLAELNQKYNIKGSYQNHAGDSLGSPIWDIGIILNNIDSPFLGCQYDIRHASVEGANSWPIGLKYISRHVNTLDIKDFVWTKSDGDWKVQNVPLGEGMVNFKEYFKYLEELKIAAPISIHYEYDLGGAEHGDRKPTIPPDQIISALKKDLDYLKTEIRD
jgi:L-ribulose-5-phosphate 3-epimerase